MEGAVVNMGSAMMCEPVLTVNAEGEIDEIDCVPNFFASVIYFELEEYFGESPDGAAMDHASPLAPSSPSAAVGW